MIKQAVILAGGFGTRISEESDHCPKPMVEFDGKPMLIHIMERYAQFGIKNFIILGGYKVNFIKNYFLNYFALNSDFEIDLNDGSVKFIGNYSKDWTVKVIDTGLNTQTGGRLKRVSEYLDNEFHFTYGDGISNVDLDKLMEAHRIANKLVTLTRVISPERFGILKLDQNNVTNFLEKPINMDRWINAGFFVVNKEALEYIDGDDTAWEEEPLKKLASTYNLNSYAHLGFWKPMDTLRDKRQFEELAKNGKRPWMG